MIDNLKNNNISARYSLISKSLLTIQMKQSETGTSLFACTTHNSQTCIATYNKGWQVDIAAVTYSCVVSTAWPPYHNVAKAQNLRLTHCGIHGYGYTLV